MIQESVEIRKSPEYRLVIDLVEIPNEHGGENNLYIISV